MKRRLLPCFPLLVATSTLLCVIGCSRHDSDLVMYDLLQPDSTETEERIEVPYSLIPQPAPCPPIHDPTENTLTLSIEQATMLALQNNRDLNIHEMNPIIAGTFAQIERGVFDPELFSEMSSSEEDAFETFLSTGTQSSYTSTENDVAIGFRQKLATGTSIEAAVEQERSISDRAPEQQSARVGLTITQSLLRGFGPAVNLVSVRQADLQTKASFYELRGFVETLLAQTETAYWNFVLAREKIAIFDQSLAVAKQQRDEVLQRIEVGMLPAIEAAAVRAEVARREQALIDAHSQLEENRLRLLNMISPDPAGRFDLLLNAVSEPRLEPEIISDLADRLLLAERSRPDLREAHLQLAQNRLQTIKTRNGLLPRLDFFIGLGRTGYADTFSDSFKEISNGGDDYTVGLRFSHFLGNRTARAQDLSARATRQQALQAVANLRQLVRLDVRLAANEVSRACRLISASKVTRGLQEKTLQAEKERFNVGSNTALQVAQAQRDLLAAKIAEVEAVISYRTALVDLYLAEGSLLERRGVQLAAK